MTILPPPAATLARVAPAAQFTAAPAATVLHVLTGTVTRCGHRTAAGWTRYAGTPPEAATVPPVRLCPRCAKGLPLELRRKLEPTTAELAALVHAQALTAAELLRRQLADLRTAALVDGSAYERVTLPVAERVARPVLHRNAPTPTRAERDLRVSGHVVTHRELTLLELLNHLDPSRPTAPGWRSWFADAPPAGTPVAVSGDYDARAYDWTRKGRR